MKTVIIGILSDDIWQADTAASIASLCLWSAYTQKSFRIAGIVNQKTSTVDRGRNDLVHQVQAIPGVTHILFVDSDMVLPRDALARLVEHDKPVVGCNALRRRQPYTPAGKRSPLGKWELGAACMLIDLEIFKSIPFPWFEGGYGCNGDYRDGDQNFCSKVNFSGQVHCDEVLSQEIGHLGQMSFTLEMHNNIKDEPIQEIAGQYYRP